MRDKALVRWRRSGSVPAAVVETRLPERLLAALPDLITSCFLAWTWAAPLDAGRDAVLGGLALVGLEIPALLGLLGLFAAVRLHGWSRKLRALFLTGFALVAAGLIAQELQRSGASAWMLLCFGWLLVAKGLVFATAWRDDTWFADGLRLALQCVALMLILAIASDLPVPRWGFDEAAVRQLALPLQPHDPRGIRLDVPPWLPIAAGSAYFAFSALVGCLLAARRRADSCE
jgi:hypothetical protein